MKEERLFGVNIFFGRVSTQQESEALIDAIAKTLFVVAAFNVALGLIFNENSLVNAVLVSLVAFWLQSTKKRIPAIVLLFFSAFASYIVTVNLFLQAALWLNVLLAYVTFIIAVRAVYAVYAIPYPRKKNQK